MRGDLKPGEQLPSIRSMASHLGVSVPTVRQALQALAYPGLLELRQGVGCFVARRPGAGRTLAINFHRSSADQLVSLRTMIEPLASGLAASRTRPMIGAQMRLLAGERARLARSPYAAEFVSADAAFHRVMVKGASLPIATDLHRRAMEQLQDATLPHAVDLAEDPVLEDLHFRLAEAVEQGAADLAVRLASELVAIETGSPFPPAHPPRAGPAT
jgi:DNA-binding FadR family transcriptional regulator